MTLQACGFQLLHGDTGERNTCAGRLRYIGDLITSKDAAVEHCIVRFICRVKSILVQLRRIMGIPDTDARRSALGKHAESQIRKFGFEHRLIHSVF